MFYVLFMCKCVLPPGVNPTAADKYINIIHLRVPDREGNFLTNRGIVRFSRRTLLHVVGYLVSVGLCSYIAILLRTGLCWVIAQRAAVITQKSAVHVCFAAEAWNHSMFLFLLVTCHRWYHSLRKSIRSASFFTLSHLMRITARFSEGLILLPSSRPALCVHRVVLQGLGLCSVEEGLLTWDGCDVKRPTCQ
jgi:hypothetical protein